MKMSVYIDERCESEYIKMTLSVFFQHQTHKHKFPLEKKSSYIKAFSTTQDQFSVIIFQISINICYLITEKGFYT